MRAEAVPKATRTGFLCFQPQSQRRRGRERLRCFTAAERMRCSSSGDRREASGWARMNCAMKSVCVGEGG